MTTNHIDQLAQWYADAEQVTKDNLPNKGDVIIFPAPSFPGYITETIPVAWPSHLVSPREHVRILDRAPKPKPAWHDAVAVIATFRDERGMVSGVWKPEGKPGYWEGPEGDVVHEDSLEAVTPLIEAKVTGEARERVWRFIQNYTGEDDRYRPDYDAEIDGYITAALGLETA